MYDDCRSNSNYIFRRALLATTTTTTSFTSTTLFRSFVSWQKRMLWLSHFIPGLVCYFTKFIVIWLHFIIIFDLMLLIVHTLVHQFWYKHSVYHTSAITHYFVIVYGGAKEHYFLPLFYLWNCFYIYSCSSLSVDRRYSSVFFFVFPYVGFAFPSVYTSDFRLVGLSFLSKR